MTVVVLMLTPTTTHTVAYNNAIYVWFDFFVFYRAKNELSFLAQLKRTFSSLLLGKVKIL